jgi:hypothetical protein
MQITININDSEIPEPFKDTQNILDFLREGLVLLSMEKHTKVSSESFDHLPENMRENYKNSLLQAYKDDESFGRLILKNIKINYGSF